MPMCFQGMTMGDFRAKDIGMRAQKKLASKLSNKTVAKMLVDDNTSQLLDNLCLLCKQVVSTQLGWCRSLASEQSRRLFD